MAFNFTNAIGKSLDCIDPNEFVVQATWPRFSGGGQGAIEGVLKGWTRYDDRDALVAELQPPSTFVGGLQTIHPYGASMPGGGGLSSLRCVHWECEPQAIHGSDLDANGYYKTQVYYWTIQYKSIIQENTPNTTDPVPYLIHRWSIGGQVLSLDSQYLAWDDIRRKQPSSWTSEPFYTRDDGVTLYTESEYSRRRRVGAIAGQDERVNAHLMLPHIQHEVTWPKVVGVPKTAIENSIGKVNDANLLLGGRTYYPETVLFTGANVQETTMSNGRKASELVYHFAIRKVVARDQEEWGGWNHFFRCNIPEQQFLTRSNPAYYPSATDPPVAGDWPNVPELYFHTAPAGTPNYAYSTQTIPAYGQEFVNAVYACTGFPGFYRLELSPGTGRNPCIPLASDENGNPINDDNGVQITLALATGYRDELAIFRKCSMGALFQAEP